MGADPLVTWPGQREGCVARDGMNVLIIGSGGREHALADALSRSPELGRLLAAPGNPGIAQLATCFPGADTPGRWLELARDQAVDLTVVGPEAPLALGVVDLFREAGLAILGPDRSASRLESSKRFAKGCMERWGIPTARYAAFSEFGEALRALPDFGFPVVIKDSALAGGKGVTIAADPSQASSALERILSRAGAEVVVEEFLQGTELSLLALMDGQSAFTFPICQDHKAQREGDQGPMTGGMGVICPLPVSQELRGRLDREILEPTLQGLHGGGLAYRGVLYCGVLVTEQGPKLLEYNVRFGDPEAEALLPLLGGGLLSLLRAAASGRLPAGPLDVQGASAALILAAGGYPQAAQLGAKIEIGDLASGVRLFHCATARRGEQLVVAGGRVLALQASAADLPSALSSVYAAAERVRFDGMQFRRDIGLHAAALR